MFQDQGGTALYIAAERGHEMCVSVLVSNPRVDRNKINKIVRSSAQPEEQYPACLVFIVLLIVEWRIYLLKA